MPLPEMPSIDQITDDIVSDLENSINQTIPALPKAVLRVEAKALAAVSYLLRQAIFWTYKQIFPIICDYEALILWGELIGIIPKLQTTAILLCSVPGTGPAVNAGTTFQSSVGVIYQVEEAVDIIGGVATDVKMLALQGGEIGNLANGEILNITSTDVGLDGTATVTGTFRSGDEAEDKELFRQRVRFEMAKRSTGGAPADYFSWGTETPNFIWVGPYNDEEMPGFLNIYGKVDNQPDGIPTSSQLIELKNYIKYDPVSGKAVRRPIGDIIGQILPIFYTDFDVNIRIQAGTPEIKSQITSTLTDYAFTLQPFILGISDDRIDTLSSFTLAGFASGIANENGAVILNLAMVEVLTISQETTYTLLGGNHVKIRNITYEDVA